MPSTNIEFMMTSFSTNATVSFDGLSEPMDEETTAIFEQVVTGQLIDASIENKDQEHQVFISSVKVIDQQVIKVGKYRRSLATTVLQIIIKVTGEVEPEAPASYVTNVTVSIQDELEEEESHQELTKRLAKDSLHSLILTIPNKMSWLLPRLKEGQLPMTAPSLHGLCSLLEDA